VKKYLYGASVQGIQGFIFETNKLQEIVGASDLIERFCSVEFLARFSSEYNIEIAKKDIVRNAGGNIRIVFSDKAELEKMVKNFPKYIMEKAYGITLSQAVVEFDENKKEYLDKKDELEFQLTKARNQAINPLDARFSLMKQTPRTGKPAFESETYDRGTKKERIEYFDKGNWQKKDNAKEVKISILLEKLKLHELYKQFPSEMDDIANDNNKIAIIHADGNKMGLMLQQMNKGLRGESDEKIQEVFKKFSEEITKSTNDAVKEAFDKTFTDIDNTIPFRPIVIGGDDVTVICHADKALKFTEVYLREFEKNTKNNFAPLVKEFKLEDFKNGLTACAGVAFCNKKFPFHYAYNLADKICTYAKEVSNRKASCLAFHNIQGSYVEDYQSYIDNELTIEYKNEKKVLLQFAPYFTEQEPKIDTLLKLHKLFSKEDIPLGKYREWLTELHKSQEYAELFLERVDAVLKSKISSDRYKEIDEVLNSLGGFRLNKLVVDNKTPMQDIMQLKSVIGRK